MSHEEEQTEQARTQPKTFSLYEQQIDFLEAFRSYLEKDTGVPVSLSATLQKVINEYEHAQAED